MRIGAAALVLDVPPGTPLGGYADRAGPATGTLDELEIAAVVFADDDSAFVVVVTELVCANEDLAADVAAAVAARVGVPAAHVWTTATHTHAGPDVNCGTGHRTTPPRWRSAVVSRAVDAAERALRAAHPAALAWRRGELHGVGAVRSVPDAAATVPVDVLTVADGDRLTGVLVVLPVHPTVLPASSALVSGDLAGAVRRALADRLRSATSAPWVVVAAGCAGDVSTRATRREQTPAELTRLANLTADQLVTITTRSPHRQADARHPVRAATGRLRLPVRADEPAPVAATVPTSPVTARIAHVLQQGEAVALERARRFPDGELDLAVAAAELGGIRLLALGAEPYVAVRDLPSVPALVLGYANGHAGYLPDAAGFGQATYESLSSPFRADAAARAVAAAEALLDREEPS